MSNVAVSLDLKNGAVEIDSASVDSSGQKDAVLLNLDRVHALNRVAREKAGGCVRTLEEIRDFKSGIYQLLFECKKLDMQGEDASSHVRDLQLLRATSEVNQVCFFSYPTLSSFLRSSTW
jgi:cilia- and flagella-associated protein 43